MIHNPDEMEQFISEKGFMPFFYCGIAGLSIAENTPEELWFSDEQDGPWEWKGPVILQGGFAYGKFFQNKAGFVSMDWFPDFLNYRRSVYRVSSDERRILKTLKEHNSLLSKELKTLCGYRKPRVHYSSNPILRESEKETEAIKKKAAEKKQSATKKKREGFETAVTKLQMGCRVVTADFEYNYDKEGKRYGWGVARYCTPEDFFGAENFEQLKGRSPEESRRRIFNHLADVLPQASEESLQKLIG